MTTEETSSPPSLRLAILAAYHTTPLAGHTGFYKPYWDIALLLKSAGMPAPAPEYQEYWSKVLVLTPLAGIGIYYVRVFCMLNKTGVPKIMYVSCTTY
jgi:hypothetical protein